MTIWVLVAQQRLNATDACEQIDELENARRSSSEKNEKELQRINQEQAEKTAELKAQVGFDDLFSCSMMVC